MSSTGASPPLSREAEAPALHSNAAEIEHQRRSGGGLAALPFGLRIRKRSVLEAVKSVNRPP
jgi:hypothetical protein